jgi:hypothetical protein
LYLLRRLPVILLENKKLVPASVGAKPLVHLIKTK